MLCPEFDGIGETCTNNHIFINENWDRRFTEFVLWNFLGLKFQKMSKIDLKKSTTVHNNPKQSTKTLNLTEKRMILSEAKLPKK